MRRPRLGDIGPVRRRVDLEPMPEGEPVHEPAAVTGGVTYPPSGTGWLREQSMAQWSGR